MEKELQNHWGGTKVSPKSPRGAPVASSGPTHRVKVGDDLVEEAQALDAPVVDALLSVEVGEIGQGGEHDADLVVGLAVKLLGVVGEGRWGGACTSSKPQSLPQSTACLGFPWAWVEKKNEGAHGRPKK